jgi:hyperosmotically inducible periplasmic protein
LIADAGIPNAKDAPIRFSRAAFLRKHKKAKMRKNMKILGTIGSALFLLAVGVLSGCSSETRKSPDVSDNIRRSLDQAGLKGVTVSEDRDKGVVTLGGNVTADADKAQAELMAKSIADPHVVADEIAVIPTEDASDAKAVDSELDKGIEKNLDAALIQNRLQKQVKYEVKNGVVTLSGNVNSEHKRSRAQGVASAVENVQQVVNEIEVKDQKATSTN